jgi:hypothetical protein
MSRRAGFSLVLLVLLGFLPGSAGAVLIDIANTYTGTVGDTVEVVVSTEDVTGLGVFSYEFTINWTSNRLTLLDVDETGTLTSSWGPPEYTSGPGTLSVAAAGAAELTGSGALLKLQFELGPASGATWLTITEFLYNEGSPAVTTDNGYVTISALPTIWVSPNVGEILVGDSLGFSVGGAYTLPIAWSTTDPVVASIDTTGFLHGLSTGSVRVIAQDAAAIVDTTDGEIDVRAMEISIPTTLNAPPGGALIIPVNVTDLIAYGVRSFEFELTFTSSQLTVTSISTVGTMTAGRSTPEATIEPGRVVVAGADATPLSGSGTLVNLLCTVPTDATSATWLTFQDALFDEQYVPLMTNGYFTVNVPASTLVTPNTAQVVVGETQLFSVGGSPTPPLVWGTTDRQWPRSTRRACSLPSRAASVSCSSRTPQRPGIRAVRSRSTTCG